VTSQTVHQQNQHPKWRPWFDAQVDRLQRQIQAIPPGERVRLAKHTSNLFRPRVAAEQPGLDVSSFTGVLSIDTEQGTADVLGMTTYEELVAATLPHGFMPLCVPQLRTITLGGAVTGLGIESASFRNGLPHESVREMDILTGEGTVLTVTGADDDPHRDLFFGFPNSYGSLGYALRLRIELEPVHPFVHLRHIRFQNARDMANTMAAIVDAGEYVGRRVDFLDGVVFAPHEQYLTLGEMMERVPTGLSVSDYTRMQTYYRSLQHRSEDVLTINDYLWRWDTDWFWCSRAFGAQRPLIRRLWPKRKLRSDVYWKLVALDRKYQFSDRLHRLRRQPRREPVVQDIEVPIDALPHFLDFFHAEVGIEPIWICPLRQRDPKATWPLYEFDPTITYVNVGFWSTVPLEAGITPDDGVVNRRIEDIVTKLDGRKSLYSTAFYEIESFWSIYGGRAYGELKERYDPSGRYAGLYEKVVKQQ
jgi:FAD/FMN-containing dehydrogenase